MTPDITPRPKTLIVLTKYPVTKYTTQGTVTTILDSLLFQPIKSLILQDTYFQEILTK